jgi:putative tryptophan/tyrosine transport system substrate-binding protein
LEILKASTEGEIDEVFATAFRDRGQPLVVTADQLFGRRRQQIANLSSRYSVPAIYSNPQNVSAGGLMSYGASVVGIFKQVGIYAGSILNGASPSELPVQQPATYQLVLNMGTAKALKLDVPPAILAMADEVIE